MSKGKFENVVPWRNSNTISFFSVIFIFQLYTEEEKETLLISRFLLCTTTDIFILFFSHLNIITFCPLSPPCLCSF